MTKIRRLRKGELKFYLSSLPYELARYAQELPENTPYIKYFVDRYEYNYVKRKWQKRK